MCDNNLLARKKTVNGSPTPPLGRLYAARDNGALRGHVRGIRPGGADGRPRAQQNPASLLGDAGEASGVPFVGRQGKRTLHLYSHCLTTKWKS